MDNIKNMIKKHWQPLFGLLFFVAAILFLLFLAGPIQREFGLYGLGITEIGLFLIALTGGFILKEINKTTLKEIFPVSLRRFTGGGFAGSLGVYAGAYFITIGISLFLTRLFPGSVEVNNYIINFFTKGGTAVAIITVAVMPGICEEFLHRGFILSAFKSIGNIAVKVLIMGIIFGIFHLDIYRFLPTMVLGMGLSYIMIKTGNLIYSIFFHFLNNFMSLMASMSVKSAIPASSYKLQNINDVLSLCGTLIFYFSLGLLFIYLGARKLNAKDIQPVKKTKKFIIPVLIITAVCGFMLSASAAFASMIEISLGAPVYEKNIETDLSEKYNSSDNFEIKQDGDFTVSMYIGGANVSGSIRIIDDSGEVIFNSGQGSDFNVNGTKIHLTKGIYTCEIELIPQEQTSGQTGETQVIHAKAGITVK